MAKVGLKTASSHRGVLILGLVAYEFPEDLIYSNLLKNYVTDLAIIGESSMVITAID